jgi:hypothetical protein
MSTSLWRFIQIGLCFRNISVICRSRVSLERFQSAREQWRQIGSNGVCFFSGCDLYLFTIICSKSHALGLTKLRGFSTSAAVLFGARFLNCPKAYMWSYCVSYSAFYGCPKAYVWKYSAIALAFPFRILGNLQLTSMLPQCWRISMLRLHGL